MVARNEVYWADLGPPAGRRLLVVLTRDAACEVLAAVTCAAITRTIRGIRSEVPVGPLQGLSKAAVINCDSVLTVPKADLDPEPVGRLDEVTLAALDRALRFALDIAY